MRPAASTLFVVSLVVASAIPPVLACGDKFLVVGRGVRYGQAYAASHPASILVWLPSDGSIGPRIGTRLDVERCLRLAGHHVRSVGDKPQLLRELRDTRFDLLIARWDDAVSLGSDGLPSPPILPIGDVRADAGHRFAAVIDNRDNPEHALAVVDGVLKRTSAVHH
jgi:hypothetical protein